MKPLDWQQMVVSPPVSQVSLARAGATVVRNERSSGQQMTHRRDNMEPTAVEEGRGSISSPAMDSSRLQQQQQHRQQPGQQHMAPLHMAQLVGRSISGGATSASSATSATATTTTNNANLQARENTNMNLNAAAAAAANPNMKPSHTPTGK